MSDFYDDRPTPVGTVLVDGRGSLPFALLHGESLVAAASWALGHAEVRLLDFTDSWDAVRDSGAALVLHDALCPGTPVEFLREAVETAVEQDRVVAGARPVTDTVRPAEGAPDDDGTIELGTPVDRDGLRAVVSPLVLPASVVAALAEAPPADRLEDLADTVAWLAGAGHEVLLLAAPATARRVQDESDLRLLEALAGDRSTPQAG